MDSTGCVHRHRHRRRLVWIVATRKCSPKQFRAGGIELRNENVLVIRESSRLRRRKRVGGSRQRLGCGGARADDFGLSVNRNSESRGPAAWPPVCEDGRACERS